ncbi:MAG: hypothetical protein LBD41_00190 [Clostridiales Family XIII bacterium]|jgi:hypothetical protein|nr:hypothetical protein [Clostridiales Family XIII bacterium]
MEKITNILKIVLNIILRNKLKSAIITFIFVFVLIFIVSYITTREKPYKVGDLAPNKKTTLGGFETKTAFPLSIKRVKQGYSITPKNGENVLIYTKKKPDKKLFAKYNKVYTAKNTLNVAPDKNLPFLLGKGLTVDTYKNGNSTLIILTINEENTIQYVLFTPFVNNKKDANSFYYEFQSLLQSKKPYVLGKHKIFEDASLYIPSNKYVIKEDEKNVITGKNIEIIFPEAQSSKNEILIKKNGKVLD